MRNTLIVLLFVFVSTLAHSEDDNRELKTSCQDFTWSDVVGLVQPYLSETLYTALIMQGQSSEYHTSAAASQAMDKSLPEDVKRILRSLIEQGC